MGPYRLKCLRASRGLDWHLPVRGFHGMTWHPVVDQRSNICNNGKLGPALRLSGVAHENRYAQDTVVFVMLMEYSGSIVITVLGCNLLKRHWTTIGCGWGMFYACSHNGFLVIHCSLIRVTILRWIGLASRLHWLTRISPVGVPCWGPRDPPRRW